MFIIFIKGFYMEISLGLIIFLFVVYQLGVYFGKEKEKRDRDWQEDQRRWEENKKKDNNV